MLHPAFRIEEFDFVHAGLSMEEDGGGRKWGVGKNTEQA
jgi:hypothetical protein